MDRALEDEKARLLLLRRQDDIEGLVREVDRSAAHGPRSLGVDNERAELADAALEIDDGGGGGGASKGDRLGAGQQAANDRAGLLELAAAQLRANASPQAVIRDRPLLAVISPAERQLEGASTSTSAFVR